MAKRNHMEDLRFLLNQGYNVPKPLIDYVYTEQLRAEGIRQVWRCITKGCGKSQKMYIPAGGVFCSCGGAMKLDLEIAP